MTTTVTQIITNCQQALMDLIHLLMNEWNGMKEQMNEQLKFMSV